MFLALLACMVVHVSAMALACVALGVGVREVSFGLGPPVLRYGRLRIGAIPLGGFVRMVRTDDPRVALCLAGPAALVALATVLLGGEGIPAFLRTFPQCVSGVLHPLTVGRDLVAAVARTDLRGLVLLGTCAAKMAAYNLLPFPSLNGGDALLAVARGGRPEAAWEPGFRAAGALALLAWLCAWITAMVAYLLQGG